MRHFGLAADHRRLNIFESGLLEKPHRLKLRDRPKRSVRVLAALKMASSSFVQKPLRRRFYGLSKAVVHSVRTEAAPWSKRHRSAINADASWTVNVKTFWRVAAPGAIGRGAAITAGARILGMAMDAPCAISATRTICGRSAVDTFAHVSSGYFMKPIGQPLDVRRISDIIRALQ